MSFWCIAPGEAGVFQLKKGCNFMASRCWIFCIQGSEKVKKMHAAVATQAQKYVASMSEVHSEVGQLRDNLREQHRIWLDFYSTVFHVSALC